MGGVCVVGIHKTFACARSRRHASVRFPPRVNSTRKLIVGIPPFFLPPVTNTIIFCCRRWIAEASAVGTTRGGGRCVSGGAGQGSRCEVSALSATSLLCAPTFTLQLLLRVRLKFWDFSHISHFPAAASMIPSLVCRAGAPPLQCTRSPVLVSGWLSCRVSDLVWSLFFSGVVLARKLTN